MTDVYACIRVNCIHNITARLQNYAIVYGIHEYRGGLALWLSLLRASRPKYARASGKQSTQSAPNFKKISSKSVHFRRSYSRTREHRSNAL